MYFEHFALVVVGQFTLITRSTLGGTVTKHPVSCTFRYLLKGNEFTTTKLESQRSKLFCKLLNLSYYRDLRLWLRLRVSAGCWKLN